MAFRFDPNELTFISQTFVSPKFADFLEIYKRDKEIIKKFRNGGFCVGYLVNVMYAKWLELTQEKSRKRKLEERDDWPWFEFTFARAVQWDGKANSIKGQSRSKKRLRRDIDHAIGLIEHQQNIADYQPTSQLNTEDNLQDTQGRNFKREFSLGSIFCVEDFVNPITIKKRVGRKNKKIKTTILNEIFKEDQMVFIVGHDHMVGAIKHNHEYHYYDSNEDLGWIVYPEDRALYLVHSFFVDNDFNLNQTAGFGFYALFPGSSETVRYADLRELLSQLSEKKRIYADNARVTALFAAAEVGSFHAVLYYLQHPPIPLKKYINRQASSDNTALYVAVRGGFFDVANILLKSGANPNIRCCNGNTPLIMAMQKENFLLSSLLIVNGANPNIKNKEGETPLFIATQKNKVSLMRLLLTHGANPNKKNSKGNSPLHESVRNGNFSLTTMLLNHNALVNVYNNEEESPLFIALSKGHFRIAELLMNQPDIQVMKKEYKLLRELLKELPENRALQQMQIKAKILLLIHEIKIQLQRVKQNKTYYQSALKKLKQVKRRAKKLDDEDQPGLILKTMLPVLQSPPLSGLSFWRRPNLQKPVLLLAEKMGFVPAELEAKKKPVFCAQS